MTELDPNLAENHRLRQAAPLPCQRCTHYRVAYSELRHRALDGCGSVVSDGSANVALLSKMMLRLARLEGSCAEQHEEALAPKSNGAAQEEERPSKS